MRTLTLALVAALATPGLAQDRAPPRGSADAPASEKAPKPGATGAPRAAHDLARALLPEQRWDRLLDGYASSLSSQVAQALLARGEQVPDDLQGRIRTELGERLRYQQTIDSHAQALASEFTADELKRTVEFYASPAGKKMLEKLPEAQAAVGQELQARLDTAVPEILQRVAPEVLASPEGAESGGTDPKTEPPAAQGRRPPEPKRR
jgi:hypothetical protein